MPRNCLNVSPRRLLAAAVLLAVSGCAAQSVEWRQSWPTYLADYERRSASAQRLDVPLRALWRRDVAPYFDVLHKRGGPQLSAPALRDGSLYVGSLDGRFYRFDAATGNLLWVYEAGAPLESPPTVDGGRVFFGSADGVMRCLDAETGREIFSYEASSEVISSPVRASDVLFFTSSNNRLYAVDAGSGEKLWTYDRGVQPALIPRFFASPALGDGRVFVLFSDGFLVALDASSGKQLWTRRVIEDPRHAPPARRTPLVREGAVYVVDGGGALVAVDTATGEEIDRIGGLGVRDFLFSGATLLIVGGDTALAMDAATKHVFWKRPLGPMRVSSLFVTADKLFLLYNRERYPLGWKRLAWTEGYVEALSIESGRSLWTTRLDSTVSTAAAVSDGHVALLTDRGTLQVLGAR
ncbi:MAG TPA: hypothetical protein ENJ37_06945 [Deltaproteobacteria bacterium]|nr:hypothetical protein [Deltaproteobacteria bacterium]